jgi:O-antigen/teichoic acid export membrane protein
MLAWSFWNVSAIVLYATNHQRSVVKVLFAASVLNCALAALLIPRWGITAAALAATLSELSLSAWLIPRTAAQTIGAPNAVFWSQAVLPVLLGLGLAVSIGLAAWRQFPVDSLRYFVIFPTTILLGLTLGWMTLARHERCLISKLSQRFL